MVEQFNTKEKKMQQEGLRDSLKQLATSQKDRVKAIVRTQDRLWFITFLVLLVGIAIFRHLVEMNFFSFLAEYSNLLYRLASAAMLAILVLTAYRGIRIYAIDRLDNVVAQYNLTQLLKLAVAVILAIIGISLFFVNWYAAAVSFGLISLVLGFALQTPISSFIGWMYILIRAPYRVGDRIKIGDASGDVIEIGYLDTTLWEFGGPYLSSDHPSGRLIRFPNSEVFSAAIYNYSHSFPFIWQEVKFQIAYDSDLDFVAQTMQRIVQQEVGEVMHQQVKKFQALVAHTAVGDYPDIQNHPQVQFSVNDNTWIEAAVRFVADPKEAAQMKSRLIRLILIEFNLFPQQVRFPESTIR